MNETASYSKFETETKEIGHTSNLHTYVCIL